MLFIISPILSNVVNIGIGSHFYHSTTFIFPFFLFVLPDKSKEKNDSWKENSHI